jgi:fructose-bisphosphate aldolase class II
MQLLGVEQFNEVPIILRTDHCAKKMLPWFDGLVEANEDHFEKYCEPLFEKYCEPQPAQLGLLRG